MQAERTPRSPRRTCGALAAAAAAAAALRCSLVPRQRTSPAPLPPVPQLWDVELDEAPVALALSPKQQLLAVATVDNSIQRACSGHSAALCLTRVVAWQAWLARCTYTIAYRLHHASATQYWMW